MTSSITCSGLCCTSPPCGPAHGPGVELLEYLTQHDGRPIPADVRANDLLHWQTTLLMWCIASLTNQLQTETFTLVSPNVVLLAERQLEFTAGLLVREPDGHAMYKYSQAAYPYAQLVEENRRCGRQA